MNELFNRELDKTLVNVDLKAEYLNSVKYIPEDDYIELLEDLVELKVDSFNSEWYKIYKIILEDFFSIYQEDFVPITEEVLDSKYFVYISSEVRAIVDTLSSVIKTLESTLVIDKVIESGVIVNPTDDVVEAVDKIATEASETIRNGLDLMIKVKTIHHVLNDKKLRDEFIEVCKEQSIIESKVFDLRHLNTI